MLLLASGIAGCAGGSKAPGAATTSGPGPTSVHAAAPVIDSTPTYLPGAVPTTVSPATGALEVSTSVAAPVLLPGQAWMWKITESSTMVGGGEDATQQWTRWEGARLLANVSSTDNRTLALGSYVSSYTVVPLATAKSNGAQLIDPASLLTKRLYDIPALHACQAKPATCDLRFAAPNATMDAPALQFPLAPGRHWSVLTEAGDLSGSGESRVTAFGNMSVVGRPTRTIHVTTTGDYTISGPKEEGVLHIVWETDYSPDHRAIVYQLGSYFAEVQTGGDDFTYNGTVERILVEAALEPQPAAGPVDLYDALGLHGRRVVLSVRHLTSTTYNVTILPNDVPLASVHAMLVDGEAHVLANWTTPYYKLSIESGSYIVRAEATYGDRVLASWEYPIAASLDKSGTVQCATPTANPPVGSSTGSCPDFAFPLKGGAGKLYVYAFVSDVSFISTSGTMELRDGAGIVVDSQSVSSSVSMQITPQGTPGQWSLRFLPDNGVSTRVQYQVFVSYTYLPVHKPVWS